MAGRAEDGVLVELCRALRDDDEVGVRRAMAEARDLGVDEGLLDEIQNLTDRPVRRAEQPDRQFARELDLMLLGEIDGRVAPLSPAAQRCLGIGYPGALIDALETITGIERDHVELNELLATARAEGAATQAIKRGQSLWRLHAYTHESTLRVVATTVAASSAREAETLATINHEMANGLTALSSLAAMARHPASSPAYVADALRRIEQTALDTLSTVKTTRKALRSRPPSSAPDNVDIGPVLRDLVESLEGLARRKGVRLETRIHRNLYASAQVSDLRSIVWNLLKNAVEAVPDGGLVRIGATSQQERIRIVVDDDGPGMDESAQRRAFQAYYTTKSTGTGLGLPLVKHLVNRLGGELVVESEKGQGTRMVVSIPRAAEALELSSGVRRRPKLVGLAILLVGPRAEMLRPILEPTGATFNRLSELQVQGAKAEMAFVDSETGGSIADRIRRASNHVIWLGDEAEATAGGSPKDMRLPAGPSREELLEMLIQLYPDHVSAETG